MDDLEADIKAAIASEKGDAAPAPAAEPVAAVEPAEAAPAQETAAQAEARARDEQGRFAKKEAAEAAAKPNEGAEPVKAPAEAKTEGADKPALQPPSHWSPEAKAAFVNAPRPLQEQALKREEEISGKAKEWQGKAEDYNRLERVIAPHRDRLAREGRDPAAAINQLFAFENAMQSNPVSGVTEILKVFARGNELAVINMIAQQNGYQLTQATNQEDAEQGYRPAQADPTVRRLEEQVQQLTQTLTQQQTVAQQQEQQKVLADIQAVATDPKNLYYENLKEKVAAIVSIGDRTGDKRPIKERVQEAYDQACWADPTVRGLIMAEQQRQQQAAAQEAARQKAAAARAASGSITGSPGVQAGARPTGSKVANHGDDIAADIMAAMNAVRA